MEIRFSKHSLAKISKHAVNVFPLEGYGFLVGTQNVIYAALPVVKTSKWHDSEDRFARLETAYEQAKSLARGFEMIVPAIYHSHSSDRIKESPIRSVPSSFRDKIVYISNVSGGELLYRSYAYRMNEKGEWTKCEFAKLSLKEITAKTNPRRILSEWSKTWGIADYGNNHETELKRLY